LGRKLFPAPLSKNSQRGILFFAIIIAFDRRAINVRTVLERLLLEERLPTEEGGEV
jgi:hypothetical protein